MDGFYKVAAKGQTTFPGRGTGGDEEKEVRIYDALVIDAADMGHAGREHGEGTEYKDVSIGL